MDNAASCEWGALTPRHRCQLCARGLAARAGRRTSIASTAAIMISRGVLRILVESESPYSAPWPPSRCARVYVLQSKYDGTSDEYKSIWNITRPADDDHLILWLRRWPQSPPSWDQSYPRKPEH